MANPYLNYLLNELQHEASRHTMEPPPPPASALDQSIHGIQNNHTSYSGAGLASSSDIYTASTMHSWEPSEVSIPLAPLQPEFGREQPSESSTRPIHRSQNPQDSSGRTTVISSDVWIRYKPVIRKLWVEEDRPLPETMAMMSEKYHFHASLDQYKKQFKKWKWSKYIPAKDGNWMVWKADQRKQELGKDTEFEYRGQTLTDMNIRSRFERKKFEPNTQGFSPEAGTPSGIKYTTPRDHVLSPPENRHGPIRNAQPTWNPPSSINRRQPQMKLVWNGRTKADFQAQYEEGLADESSGRAVEAEVKFRNALDGLDNLLSTTHPETVAVAYRLASFYAKQIRMKDADTVLDWVTQTHLEDYGLCHSRTFDHVGHVVEMFRNWGRPGDATEFLKQFLHGLDKREPHPDDSEPPTATANSPPALNPRAGNTSAAHEGEQASESSIRFTNPVEPAVLQAQLRQASELLGDESGEAMLLRLVNHCEENPDKLMVESFLCYSALLNHYDNIDDEPKKSNTLDKVEQAVMKIICSGQKMTEDLLKECLQLAKYFVKAGRYASADDIFSQIEANAQETFGSDHFKTIWFLVVIGTFYQNEGRWQDAAPRFEHALAASLSKYGERHESVKRLEDALENQWYESYVPSKDEETHSWLNEPPIPRVPVPEVYLVDLRLLRRYV